MTLTIAPSLVKPIKGKIIKKFINFIRKIMNYLWTNKLNKLNINFIFYYINKFYLLYKSMK